MPSTQRSSAKASWRAYWISYRVAVGAVGSVNREIEVSIKTPDGALVDYNCFHKARFAGDSDYMLLRPGVQVSAKVDLTCFGLAAAHTYKITASYEDKNPRPPTPPGQAARLRGVITSNEITIQTPDSEPSQ